MNVLNTDDLILEAIEQYRKSLEEPAVKTVPAAPVEPKPEEVKQPESKKSSVKANSKLPDMSILPFSTPPFFIFEFEYTNSCQCFFLNECGF
jgi:hypothetical protein